jgi:hypothetical protein
VPIEWSWTISLLLVSNPQSSAYILPSRARSTKERQLRGHQWARKARSNATNAASHEKGATAVEARD